MRSCPGLVLLVMLDGYLELIQLLVAARSWTLICDSKEADGTTGYTDGPGSACMLIADFFLH